MHYNTEKKLFWLLTNNDSVSLLGFSLRCHFMVISNAVSLFNILMCPYSVFLFIFVFSI